MGAGRGAASSLGGAASHPNCRLPAASFDGATTDEHGRRMECGERLRLRDDEDVDAASAETGGTVATDIVWMWCWCN